MALEAAHMGIDLGSTSTRLCLYTSATHRMFEVECPERSKLRNGFDAGDFSSRCYPFNSVSKIYKGNSDDRNHTAASLKPILLLLSELPEEQLHPLIIEYPVAQAILDNLNTSGFLRRLERGVQQLFQVLWKAALGVCAEQKLCITGIGVTTPQQWPSQVDDLYAQMILKCFRAKSSPYLRITTDSIYFLGETQALAHYLFHQHSDKVWAPGFEEDVLLILDFGGQNLSISMYHVDYTAENKRAFFEIGHSQGFVGGGEQFDYFIGEYCEQYIREHLRQEPDAGVKQSLINMFHTKKQDLGPDFEYDYEDHELYLTWGSNIRVTLSPEVLEDAFNKALGGPLAHADNLLFKASQVMAGRGNRGPWAIVTGGTSRSKVLQARLTSMCETKGFRKPLFVEDDSVSIANRFPSHSIAKGAAYAMASTLTVEEFLARSAIGLQMRQSDGTLWDSEGQILFFQGTTFTRTIQLRDHDELKLICDPAHNDLLSEQLVHSTTAYDLYNLGFFKRGTLQVKVELGGTADDASLDVYLSWNPEFPDPCPQDWELGLVKLPLFADRATCCVLVELSSVDSQPPPSSVIAPPPRDLVGLGSDSGNTDISSHFPTGSSRRRAAQRTANMRAEMAEEDWDDEALPESPKNKTGDDWKFTPGNDRRRRWLDNMKRMEAAEERRRKRNGPYVREAFCPM